MLTIDASNLPRFMQCNGYRLLQADPVFPETDTTVREEGNAAHWLASVVFAQRHTTEELTDRKAPNGVMITPEMAEHVDDYLDTLRRSSASSVFIEHAYSLDIGAGWIVNGRADAIGITETILSIDDFKYGYSIVEPERNWTLIAHAIGFCRQNGLAPSRFSFTIHQPRASHRNGTVRNWTIDAAEMHALMIDLYSSLTSPSDVLQTGKHCYKCPAFVGCPARQDAELTGIEIALGAYRSDLTNAELGARLDQIDRAAEMLKQAKTAYEDEAKSRIRNGAIISNHDIEPEYTNRVWKDGVSVELMAALSGGVNFTKPQIITPAQAEKLTSKEFVAPFCERRLKGHKLTRVNANKRAAKFFGNKK